MCFKNFLHTLILGMCWFNSAAAEEISIYEELIRDRGVNLTKHDGEISSATSEVTCAVALTEVTESANSLLKFSPFLRYVLLYTHAF